MAISMASGRFFATWLILPLRSANIFCKSSGDAARGVVVARVKITLSAPRFTLSSMDGTSLSEQQPKMQTMLSYGTCAPTHFIKLCTLAGLCAPSTKMRGRSLMTSMRPGTLTLPSPRVTLFSGQSNPRLFKISTAESARPQFEL